MVSAAIYHRQSNETHFSVFFSSVVMRILQTPMQELHLTNHRAIIISHYMHITARIYPLCFSKERRCRPELPENREDG